MNLTIICFLVTYNLSAYCIQPKFSTEHREGFKDISSGDTLKVIELNKLGYSNRLIDAKLTLTYANKALDLSKQIKYLNGIAEAYRIKGIGEYYLDRGESALEKYLYALHCFKQNNNKEGQAKVYNNIGTLYMDVDFDKSLEYFKKALKIAQNLKSEQLLASLYGNIGNMNQRKKNYNLALSNYQKSTDLFSKLKLTTGLTQGLQNIGVVYFNLNQLDKAEKYLLLAIKNAKENKLNNIVARTNLTLISIYIVKNRLKDAETAIQEGILFSKMVKDPRLQHDYIYTSYELEYSRKNYQKALLYLKQVYKQDSLTFTNSVSDKLGLQQKEFYQLQKQKEIELIIEKQKQERILFWASSIVAGLSFIVIFLLFRNVRKTTENNKKLTLLNKEVFEQKENLDQVNQNLEKIIEKRTQDLKIKNKKLSEYSSHLSHEIRSPVATLKGLMMLEQENMIEHSDLMKHIHECVNDIDNKIINISEMLNNPKTTAFKMTKLR